MKSKSPRRLAGRLRSVACLCAVALGSPVWLNAHRAMAQSEEAISKVKDLNQKALAAYENLDLDEARKLLTDALEICAREGMNEHPWKARSHVHLGAILVGGFQQNDLAAKQFQRAFEIQPGITLTPALRNPETVAVFEQAKASMDKDAAAASQGRPSEAPSPGPTGDVSGIFHEPVASAPVGAEVEVRARVGPGISFKRLVLAYRPEGVSTFLARDMLLGADAWFAARIPEPATQGGLVQYYIEARDEAGQAVANNGSEAEPHVVALGDAALGALGAAEDDELPTETETPSGDDRTGFVFGASVGTGFGYVSGTPEVNTRTTDDEAISFSGVAPAKVGHLNLEAGYALRPGFILSAMVRLQKVSGPTVAYGVGQGTDGKPKALEYAPATGAFAAFGKATWLLRSPGTLRPYVSVLGGAGELRHVVDIGSQRSDCGPLPRGYDPDNPESPRPDDACIDTVKSGPVFAGGSAGVIVKVADALGLTAGINALVGLPNVALHADLNLGLLLLM